MASQGPQAAGAPAFAIRTPLPRLPRSVVAAAAVGLATALGALLAYDAVIGIAVLAGLAYAAIALVNLPLAIALWLPTAFLNALPGIDAASHAGSAVIALAWFGTLYGRRERAVPGLRGQQWALALFVVWLAVSIIWSKDASAASTALLPWGAAALFFIVLVTLDLDRRQVRLLLGAFIAGVVISVLVGMVGGLSPQNELSAITEEEGRLSGGEGDPNYLAAGIVPAIVLAAGLAGGARRFLPRLALLAAAGILTVGLASTQSRGGLLAAVVGTVLALIVAKHGRAWVVALVALVIGVGAVWFASTPDAWERVTSTADAGNGRGSLWRVAGRIFSDHPIVGVGLDNYQRHAPEYTRGGGRLEFVNFIAEKPHVVHNTYLQLLVETGIVGLALFLAILAASLRAAVRAARRFEELGDLELATISRTVLVAMVAGLTASFFISNGPDFQLWALLALGPVLLALAASSTATGARPRLAAGRAGAR
jgi:putative inorganic carbon (HCO3(-)) transporter